MAEMKVATATNGTLALDESTVESFGAQLHGNLLQPGDAPYDEVRQLWNKMFDKRPAMIARCSGVADVIDAVNFAREHDLITAVRSGGHNVGGNSSCDGGLMIDLSLMRGVRVDPGAQTVRAQGGATWGDVDREAQVFGLATPGGVVSTTGVAGLTLGGGLGWLRSKYGLSIDNLLSVDIVTADGQFLTASEQKNAELFWGLRGGGGNFGIVTSFEFQLHAVGPEVMLCAVMYPVERARDLLPVWRDFMASASDEVTSNTYIWNVPAMAPFPEEVQGVPVFIVTAMYAGPAEEGEQVLQPLRELAEPVIDLSGRMPYTAVQTMFDPFFPKGGQCAYFKSTYLRTFDDAVIDAIVERCVERPSPRFLIAIWHIGGAMRRVNSGETAFGSREAPILFSIDAMWDEVADSDDIIAWARMLWGDMQRFSTGGLYVNFAGLSEEGEDLVRAVYGSVNYERLVALKNQYDPGNLFRLNHNVRPTAS